MIRPVSLPSATKCRNDTLNFYMKCRFVIMRDYLGGIR